MMTASTMERPVTFPTQADTVIKIKRLVRVVIPGIQMVWRQASTLLIASLACMVVSIKNGLSPFPVSHPHTRTTGGCALASPKVGMLCSTQKAHSFVFALIRTGMFSTVGLVKDWLTTYLTVEMNAPPSFVVRSLAKMRLPVLLFGLFGSHEANVPGGRLTHLEGITKPGYTILGHEFSDSTTGVTKPVSHLFGRQALGVVESLECFFCWFHEYECIIFLVLCQFICTATNTWRRVAHATF